jgi:hypothetical protein
MFWAALEDLGVGRGCAGNGADVCCGLCRGREWCGSLRESAGDTRQEMLREREARQVRHIRVQHM